jgi:hypothetical protein
LDAAPVQTAHERRLLTRASYPGCSTPERKSGDAYRYGVVTVRAPGSADPSRVVRRFSTFLDLPRRLLPDHLELVEPHDSEAKLGGFGDLLVSEAFGDGLMSEPILLGAPP